MWAPQETAPATLPAHISPLNQPSPGQMRSSPAKRKFFMYIFAHRLNQNPLNTAHAEKDTICNTRQGKDKDYQQIITTARQGKSLTEKLMAP
jgi:hypothetical protein